MALRDTLLLVDDQRSNRAILRKIFEDNYNLLEAENGEQALSILQEHHSNIAAMLLDVVMPVMDGYQVLIEMKERGLLGNVPVIVISSSDSIEHELKSFSLGATDIITKPYEPLVVRRRVQNTVELNRHKGHLQELVDEQALKLSRSNQIIVDTLATLVESRSMESGQHILRIRHFTKLLLEDIANAWPEYNLTERDIRIVANASALHDIGKISISDVILNKPGRLTKDEFEVMKTHTVTGCRMLEALQDIGDQDYLRYAYNICRYHHERWDGKGYPDGLSGDSIPIYAQAVGLADAYDALTTKRVYKDAYSHEKAQNMILNGECGAFSTKLLESFKHVSPQFAELAQRYADGASPNLEDFSLPTPDPQDSQSNPLHMAQEKYRALLYYTDSTVVEIDLDIGSYHIVHDPNPDFSVLHSGSTFEESINNLVRQAVHPDDRDLLTRLFPTYMQEIFTKVQRTRTLRHRVRSGSSGKYHWYDMSITRINTGLPSRRCALCIWRNVDQAYAAIPEAAPVPRIPHALYRRNDLYLTIEDGTAGELSPLCGYSPEEIQNQFYNHMLELIVPEDQAQFHHQLAAQFARGNRAELEYRLRHKDGRAIWVHEKSHLIVENDGTEHICCTLIDIDQCKRERVVLHRELERHRLILEQIDDIILEWDMQTDSITYSSNWYQFFGYHPVATRLSHYLTQSDHFHPDDLPTLLEKIQFLRNGADYQELEARILGPNDHYFWCKVRGRAQYGQDGTLLRILVVITDIDTDRRNTQKLQAQAERDGLTQLLNKTCAQQRVKQYLAEAPKNDCSALMLIDLDHFKQLNDHYGHMFGDEVLVHVSENFRQLFRTEDVVARVGGDEFMVFMQNISGEDLVVNRATQVIESLKHILVKELNGNPISCSIGIAFAPEHGRIFQDLFRRADIALYQAKSQGRSCHVCYSSALSNDLPPVTDLAQSHIVDTSATEKAAPMEGGLTHYIFQSLRESKDLEPTIVSLLELVGHRFHVSRVYICENDPDNEHYSNTLEWCDDGIPSIRAALQNFPYSPEPGLDHRKNFNDHDIFYCPDVSKLPQWQRDTLEPRGIKSILQYAIRDNGEFRGFIGFDECTAPRLWVQEQINVLNLLSDMLCVFLLKKRTQDNMANQVDSLRSALDTQNTRIYIIDPETHELLFLNAKALESAPDASEGVTCFKRFMGLDAPCAICPATDIKRNRKNRMVIEDKLNGNRKILADAAYIRWNGQDACLITCSDLNDEA